MNIPGTARGSNLDSGLLRVGLGLKSIIAPNGIIFALHSVLNLLIQFPFTVFQEKQKCLLA